MYALCSSRIIPSITIGAQAIATGVYSIAIGPGCNTNGKDGAMVIGDDSYFQTAYASADNELTMRFSGGYRLWSSYPDSTSGVYMRHGMSGWSNYCDRNKKENFRQLDGEQILQKIHDIPVTEWNYKGNTEVRYVGPMAQDLLRRSSESHSKNRLNNWGDCRYNKDSCRFHERN